MKKFSAIILAALMLTSCGGKPDTANGDKEPSATKSTAAEELIDADRAVEIALEDAKSSAEGAVADILSDADPKNAACEITALNGIPVYNVEIKKDKLVLCYAVDSQTGAIKGCDRFFDTNDPDSGASPSAFGSISDPETAADFAAWYFGLDRASLEDLAGEFNTEKYYASFLKFNAGGTEYKCLVDTFGRLQRSNVDIGFVRAKELCYNYLPTAVAEDQREDVITLSLSGYLKDSAVTASGSLDERIYDVSFNLAGYDYRFTVDAHSGDILSAKCEPDGSDDIVVGGFESVEGSAIVQPEVEDPLETSFPL